MSYLQGIEAIQKQVGMHPSDLDYENEWTPVYWQIQASNYGEDPLPIQEAQFHTLFETSCEYYEYHCDKLNRLTKNFPDWRQNKPSGEILEIISNPAWIIAKVDVTDHYSKWPKLCRDCCWFGRNCTHTYDGKPQLKIEDDSFKLELNTSLLTWLKKQYKQKQDRALKTMLDKKMSWSSIIENTRKFASEILFDFDNYQKWIMNMGDQTEQLALTCLEKEESEIIDLTKEDELDWTAPVLEPVRNTIYKGCYEIDYEGCYGNASLNQSPSPCFKSLPFGVTNTNNTIFKNMCSRTVSTQTTEHELLAIEYPVGGKTITASEV